MNWIRFFFLIDLHNYGTSFWLLLGKATHKATHKGQIQNKLFPVPISQYESVSGFPILTFFGFYSTGKYKVFKKVVNVFCGRQWIKTAILMIFFMAYCLSFCGYIRLNVKDLDPIPFELNLTRIPNLCFLVSVLWVDYWIFLHGFSWDWRARTRWRRWWRSTRRPSPSWSLTTSGRRPSSRQVSHCNCNCNCNFNWTFCNWTMSR